MKILVVAAIVLLIALGAYYYIFSVMQTEDEVIEESRGLSADLDAQVHRIPAGAVMEDGTLPE